MLPLMSKITPNEMGASSIEKCRISCRFLPSKTSKFFLVEADIQAFVVIADRHRYQYQVDIYLDGAVVGDERRSNLSWRFRRIDVNLVNQALGATSRRRYRNHTEGTEYQGIRFEKTNLFLLIELAASLQSGTLWRYRPMRKSSIRQQM